MKGVAQWGEHMCGMWNPGSVLGSSSYTEDAVKGCSLMRSRRAAASPSQQG